MLVTHSLYAPFVRDHDGVLVMDRRSAEFTQYAANAKLATCISFSNELSRLAEHVGVGSERVRQGIGTGPRIGLHFLYAGVGYGGSCFPKYVKALASSSADASCPSQLLGAVAAVK